MRVLLVDDGPEFVAAAIAFLRDLREAELVGVAPCTDVAERYVARLAPDLVLLSLALPDARGLELVERIGGRHRVPVIALGFEEAEACRTAALRAGAFDFVARGDFVTRLPAVIRALSAARGSEKPQPSAKTRAEKRDAVGAATGVAKGTRADTGEVS